MRLGTCYYPEHWPPHLWVDDARRMVDMGLSRVRIGEFAWSRIEPAHGVFQWDWLDTAIETLHAAGLGIILGTPTATPPKWLVDAMPDMVAIDADGKPRSFGSRRHYCFSHQGYAAQAARIVEAVAARYGNHPAIVQWQTDNEYGCHDTVLSYSQAALRAFRKWLADHYTAIDGLNAAWGNVFWSMDYPSFESIDLPNLTVTEANPAHWLDFRRFSSDQVVRFNKMQADILRSASPGRDIVHNFMGFFTEFDHHAVSRDLDVASWDSYPLGFLEQFWFSDADKRAYLRQGHPDIAAFHHALYRGCTRGGRWSVMEQQPGPVNWARFNPVPLPNMVRLWTLEAMAHGAEMVSYFRWRQLPQAQEQMHAGLLRSDNFDAPAAGEVRAAATDIQTLNEAGPPLKSVALIVDYQSDWVTSIQPQGRGFKAQRLAYEMYTALRRLALDVDIIQPDADLTPYQMVVVPCLPIMPTGFVDKLAAFSRPVLIGPRTGSKTANFAIPPTLPPGDLQRLIPIKVTRVESLPDHLIEQGQGFAIGRWLEHIESDIFPERQLENGLGVVWGTKQVRYLSAWPDGALLNDVFCEMAGEAGLSAVVAMPDGLRISRTSRFGFAFNYSAEPVTLPDGIADKFVIGGPDLPAAGVAVWRL
jgi:beta-galactosidase